MDGFNNEKYLQLQSEKILERISLFDNKLYLEFGGKIFDDLHASRVLPGFKSDNKIKLLHMMRDQLEIILVIGADDIYNGKMRRDYGISYDKDLIRLLAVFQNNDLHINGVVITKYEEKEPVDRFISNIKSLHIPVYRHYRIDNYPQGIDQILSDKGFGRNDYIQIERPLVVVTAPGASSGKFATCLSQLYHDQLHGIRSGYAKFELFPIWNLSTDHPINMAYEASTADLNDMIMVDHFHKAFYGKDAVNYNRDLNVYPILNNLLETTFGRNPYNSPTDMGVNVAGYCISDQNFCNQAAYKEIVRRFDIAKEGSKEKERIWRILKRYNKH